MKLRRKKRKSKPIYFVLLAILFIGLVVGISYISLVTKEPEVSVDLNEILFDPDEFNNPIYLHTLTIKQIYELMDSMENFIFEACADGKITRTCSLYVLDSYMRMRMNLETIGIYKESALMNEILRSVYLDLKSTYTTLTEDDLGTIIPFLSRYCSLGNLDQTERVYWTKKIIDVEKTDPAYTDLQVFYFINCLNSREIELLSAVTLIDVEELNEKVCDVLPNLQDIDKTDLCVVYDYAKVKVFCGELNPEGKNLVKSLLAEEYETNFQKNCKNLLSTIRIE